MSEYQQQQQQQHELFEQTSQYRHWRFTADELTTLRSENNKQGIERLRRSLAAEAEATHADSTRAHSAEQNLLTPHDELSLIDYYLQKIRDYAKVYRFSNAVKATAITFMKRFYLRNVVLDYPPKSTMLTCLYLATKVENAFMKIDDFTRPLARAKVTSDDVIGLEFVVSQSLQFELAVHQPYRPAYGFFLDMQDALADSQQQLMKSYERAVQYVDASLFTDLAFLYQPAQIALGAWKLAAAETNLDVDGYLTAKFDARSLEALYPILDEIQDEIRRYTPVTVKQAQAIDRKLILCRNPEKNPNSELYKKEGGGDVEYRSDSDSE